MQLPFSAAQFVEVFARYNGVVWPVAIIAYAAGIAAIFFALKPNRARGIGVGLILSAMWAFTGIGYHLLSFSAINPAARIFAVQFVIGSVVLAVASLRGKLTFTPRRDARTIAGLALASYAMVIYPALGFVFGHGYPNGPVFGLTPCPLAIFTFGMLLLADRPPLRLGIVPVVWALIGSMAALSLGILEDVGLLVAAATYLGFTVAQRQPARTRMRGARAPRPLVSVNAR